MSSTAELSTAIPDELVEEFRKRIPCVSEGIRKVRARTGCIGFGYEPLALASLAQHGVDEKGWPHAVVRGAKAEVYSLNHV